MENVEEIVQALLARDARALRVALDEGLDPGTSDGHHTLLLSAIEGDCSEAVELLLARGADVNAMTPYGTALHYAIDCAVQGANAIEDSTGERLKPSTTIVETLIRAGADINAIAPDGRTPLEWAQDGPGEPYNGPAVALLQQLGAKDARALGGLPYR
jgi:ankyrin repeat protein